jgi:tRNA1(Val) A37 N6-methylase TrmN6
MSANLVFIDNDEKDINEDFSNLSISFNKKLSKEERQSNGIFFTPLQARRIISRRLNTLFNSDDNINILEPSFGSGEFIFDMISQFPKSNIFGVEKHKDMYKAVLKEINNLPNTDNFNLTNIDFLKWNNTTKMNLIIGNPPYFVVKDKNPNCMTGRGNIFILFLYKCLIEHLEKDGILAFVLPTSLYNCTYYEPCRKYIKENCKILFLKNISVSYYDTNQDTMIIIIQNTKSTSHKYIVELNNNIYFSPYYKELKELLINTKTLKELNCTVKTGEIVWNENKEKLTDDPNKAILVVYTTNIVNNELIFNTGPGTRNTGSEIRVNLKGEKKQYIKETKKTPIKGPAILISRGYGNKYKLSFAAVDENITFFGENHINVIYPSGSGDNSSIIQIIKKSLESEKTNKFIKYFIGNGALSKTEIENILPIFLN